jgi:hypothetical protein
MLDEAFEADKDVVVTLVPLPSDERAGRGKEAMVELPHVSNDGLIQHVGPWDPISLDAVRLHCVRYTQELVAGLI